MEKEVVMRRILELTFPKNWLYDKKIVAEVQRLGKIIWENGGKKPREIAVWYNGKILVSGTARELTQVLEISESTIRNHISKQDIDTKGRQFKYLEEVKGDDGIHEQDNGT